MGATYFSEPPTTLTTPLVGAGRATPTRVTESPSGSTPSVGTGIVTVPPARTRATSGRGVGGVFGASFGTTVTVIVPEV